jgi:hypothetical protein
VPHCLDRWGYSFALGWFSHPPVVALVPLHKLPWRVRLSKGLYWLFYLCTRSKERPTCPKLGVWQKLVFRLLHDISLNLHSFFCSIINLSPVAIWQEMSQKLTYDTLEIQQLILFGIA